MSEQSVAPNTAQPFILERRQWRLLGRVGLAVMSTAYFYEGCSYLGSGEHVVFGLEFIGFGVFVHGLAIGLKKASSLAWTLRGVTVALVYCAFHGYGVWRVLEWVSWAVLVAAGVGGQHLAHEALGFIIDEQGERQRVRMWHRGRAIYEASSHRQRLVEEALAKSERRKKLLWGGLLWSAPALAAYWLSRSADYWIVAYPVGAVAGLFLLPWLWELFFELLYQSGYEHMRGAKVLDQPPAKLGVEKIYGQKAHGDALDATEDEAIALLGG